MGPYGIEFSRDAFKFYKKLDAPTIRINYAQAMKFQVSYNFLPPSVMPHLIVRLHGDIKHAFIY